MGNAANPPSQSPFYTHELITLLGQRIMTSAASNSSLIQGCYIDIVTGLEQCLQPFTTYLIEVRAITDLLTGLASSLFITTPSSAPTMPPTSITPDVIQATSATLWVHAPAVLSGILISFRGEGVDERGGRYTMDTPVTLSAADQLALLDVPYNIFLSPLPSYTKFNFSFAAVTADGIGPFSSPISFTTAEDKPQQAQRPILFLNITSGLIVVSWSPPYPLPGIILYYLVYRDCGSNNNDTGIIYNGTLTSFTLTNVCNGVQVAAATSVGVGPYSNLATLSQPSQNGNNYNTNGSAQSSMSPRTYAIPVVASFVGLVLVVLGLVALRRRMASRRISKDLPLARFDPGPADRFEFDRKNLQIGRELGHGAFGLVCEGVAYKIQEFPGPLRVAVKQCSNDSIRTEDKEEFMGEANLMKKFCGQIWHRNVVRLLGVCTREEPLLIITEILDRGDLKEFLRSRRPLPGGPARLSLSELVLMMEDVANGMAFLAAAEFVHRDLACRNCLVAQDMTVKISDFGLARFLEDKDCKIYICMCIYICIYVCMYVCMYVYMYVYICVCMYVYMYVYMYVCVCVCKDGVNAKGKMSAV